MPAHRYIAVSVAALLSVTIALVIIDFGASASDENVASHAATDSAPEVQSAQKRKVRVIDLSAANAVSSDHTKWFSRTRTPPAPKRVAAPIEKAHAARVAEKPKKKIVRRDPPAREAYASQSPEPAQRGFGLFDWR